MYSEIFIDTLYDKYFKIGWHWQICVPLYNKTAVKRVQSSPLLAYWAKRNLLIGLFQEWNKPLPSVPQTNTYYVYDVA